MSSLVLDLYNPKSAGRCWGDKFIVFYSEQLRISFSHARDNRIFRMIPVYFITREKNQWMLCPNEALIWTRDHGDQL